MNPTHSMPLGSFVIENVTLTDGSRVHNLVFQDDNGDRTVVAHPIDKARAEVLKGRLNDVLFRAD